MVFQESSKSVKVRLKGISSSCKGVSMVEVHRCVKEIPKVFQGSSRRGGAVGAKNQKVHKSKCGLFDKSGSLDFKVRPKCNCRLKMFHLNKKIQVF